ncbi:dirigent protein 21-like [Rutidosis leptorrhynchoides]|uniref:dirigent protein 21-like n=1 Tax=Rutidosis leptorrhynchoides TaxID=125765 RepID=UPI003A99FD02
MAQFLPKYTIFTLFLLSFLLQTQSNQFSENLTTKSTGFKREKLTHLHFYFHDIAAGDHPTVVNVAKPPTTNTSDALFGPIYVVDDPLTIGPNLTSKIVGRAQGMYALSSLSEFRLVMSLSYVFTEGKYNGSTLSILGGNSISAPVREMPVVGGSGLFRFARGYAVTKTHFFNATNEEAVVEYDVYVLHY